NTSKNTGSRGYSFMTNGVIIQWGNDSKGTKSFPITFPNACRSIVVTDNDDGAPDVCAASPISKSQFTIESDDSGIMYWLAIGY
ncbi:gp53-like domain-containing protein, partial [Vibrio paucivorans]